MLDGSLRPWKEKLLGPLAHGPLRGVTPDQLTWAGLLFGLLCAAAAAVGAWRWAVALWLANRVCDGLDGTLARVRGLQSDWGGYLDILLDHIVYAAIPLGIAVRVGCWPECAFLQATYFVNTISWCYLAALLEKRALRDASFTSVTMPAALIEGSETVIFFTMFLLWPQSAPAGFLLKGLLVSAGVWQRYRLARRLLS